MLQRALLVALTAGLFTASCAGTGPRTDQRVDQIEARHYADLRAFEAEKARFKKSVDLSKPLEFGDLGRIYLRDVELIGWPGNTFLRVEYTYLHTGVRTRVAPVVELGILDPASGDELWVTQELGVTFGIELGTGSTFTTWLEMPTEGLHRRAGWTWEIAVVPPESARDLGR